MGYAQVNMNLVGFSRNRPRSKEKKVIIQKLVERDGTDCWICGHPIDMNLPRNHEESATIEHRHSISNGGGNMLENLRLSHKCCNERRGNPVLDDAA